MIQRSDAVERIPGTNLPLRRGAENWRHKPVGTVRAHVIRGRTRVLIKVSDQGPESQRWQYLAIVVWDRSHGSVPAGHCLWLRNGNSLDCHLENLELITQAERLRRNIAANVEHCRQVWGDQARALGPKHWRTAVDAHRLAAHRRRIVRAGGDAVDLS